MFNYYYLFIFFVERSSIGARTITTLFAVFFGRRRGLHYESGLSCVAGVGGGGGLLQNSGGLNRIVFGLNCFFCIMMEIIPNTQDAPELHTKDFDCHLSHVRTITHTCQQRTYHTTPFGQHVYQAQQISENHIGTERDSGTVQERARACHSTKPIHVLHQAKTTPNTRKEAIDERGNVNNPFNFHRSFSGPPQTLKRVISCHLSTLII